VARTGENRKTYGVLVGKPEGKRQLGRFKSGWEDITMILKGYNGKARAGLSWLSIARNGGLL
jgi:hypothetical protein